MLKFTPLQNNENRTRNHNDQRNRQWSRRIARVHAEDRRSIHDGRKARTVKQQGSRGRLLEQEEIPCHLLIVHNKTRKKSIIKKSKFSSTNRRKHLSCLI